MRASGSWSCTLAIAIPESFDYARVKFCALIGRRTHNLTRRALQRLGVYFRWHFAHFSAACLLTTIQPNYKSADGFFLGSICRPTNWPF